MSVNGGNLEDQVKQVVWTLWGVTGSNGVVGDLKDFRREFSRFVAKEEERREEDGKAQRARDRNLVLAALGVIGTLIAVIVTLIVVVAGTHG